MPKRFSLIVTLLCLAVFTPLNAMANFGDPNIRVRSNFNATPTQPTTSNYQKIQPQSVAPVINSAQIPVAVSQGNVSEYVLGIGDKVRLTVFGETDLSGDYVISSTGKVALPLIGDVLAAGNSVRAFEQAVRQKLSNGYLRDPRVSAQVINYRPFFILGEVAKPGSYPYVNGMRVVNAVALAGGYTYRADRKDIRIKHSKDNKKEALVPEEAIVMPGDIIRVPERFF